VRRFVHAALGVAVLAALALAALAVLLPALVASDAARARVAAAAEAALGRELRYERLELGMLSPALVMVAPVMAGATSGAPPFAEAHRVTLRVAKLSLLARSLWIDQIVVEGATLRLEDAAVEPAVPWELRKIEAKLRGESPEVPVRVEASFELARGGRARVQGSVTLAGKIDLVLTLEDVALAYAAAYLEAGARLAGAVSGTLALEGPARNPRRISARLALRDGDVRLEAITLRGPLRVEADLAGGLDARSGRFVVDATDAELVFGGSYRKPPGISATVSGRVVSGPGGVLAIDDVKLRVRGREASARRLQTRSDALAWDGRV